MSLLKNVWPETGRGFFPHGDITINPPLCRLCRPASFWRPNTSARPATPADPWPLYISAALPGTKHRIRQAKCSALLPGAGRIGRKPHAQKQIAKFNVWIKEANPEQIQQFHLVLKNVGIPRDESPVFAP
jgi:hypothetical protein